MTDAICADELYRIPGYTEVRSGFDAGTITPTRLIERLIARAERWQPSLNCFTVLTTSEARRAAHAADCEQATNVIPTRPLCGIPVAIKDCIDTAGVRTTAGSRAWRDRVPSQDARIVAQLRRAGIVPMGKANLDEWCYGAPSRLWGEVFNPWGREWVVGGSSSGSAVAVAAGFCLAALGTDAGGSVRFPAATCGVFGLKPTNGTIDRHGIAPACSSLDSVGILARDVAGCVAIHAALAGPPTFTGLSATVGVECVDGDGLDPEVEAALEDAGATLASRAILVDADLSFVDSANATHRTISLWEAWQNHGDRMRRSPSDFHPRVRERLERAARVRSSDHARANRERAYARRAAQRLFERIDVLLGPALLSPPWRREQTTFRLDGRPVPRWDFVARRLAWQNLTGHPALTVPFGLTADGRPLAVQLTGRHGEEGLLFALADLLTRERPAAFPSLHTTLE